MENIITPVKVNMLVRLLREANYNEGKISFLQNGFSSGFDLRYQGSTARKCVSDNIPLKVGSKTELWNKLMKEVGLKRVARPFEKIPFENYIQSPIGLVPKAGGDGTRLIFHLSFDFKDDKDQKIPNSVNACTPRNLCSVKYRDLDFAVQTYLQLAEEILQQEEDNNKAPGERQGGTNRANLRRRWKRKFTNHR